MIRTAPAVLLAIAALAGCSSRGGPAVDEAAATTPLPVAGSPGFPPTAERARAQLAGLEVAWGEHGGTYERSAFGETWSDDTDAPGGHNGCDTRDDVLRRDLSEQRAGPRDPCVPLSGVLHDPYTGKELRYSYRKASRIRTDHVVALAAAWRSGAWAWPAGRRLTYANDLDVLVATDEAANQEKSARTPDRWKPPRREYWCEYGRRWTGIKEKYRLTVSPPEKAAVEELLATCP
ncbi:HNH endonuclease family protein [Streptomyces sp. NPDC056069]|uniref:HNH endonuclease family protein n=1 Tax=Streptomyces sp. NPDC056069 TaxID=3345702 RepID=UPI0035DDBE17